MAARWAKQERAQPRYRQVRIVGHPLAGKTSVLFEHIVVLYEKIGPGSHPCHWCGKMIEWRPGKEKKDAICVDHLDNDGQNNHPDNLAPSCHRCNTTRQREGYLVRDDELFIVDSKGIRHRAVLRICKRCDKEFLHIAAVRDPKHGQYCSKECAYQRNHPPAQSPSF